MKTKINSHTPAPIGLVVAAFAAVYLIWGSTYLAIKFAVESIPPFLMAGTRNVVPGLLLLARARARGAAWPSRLEWRDATIAGALMLTLGNGGVTWAEKIIPSGVTALLLALTPAWMVLFDWLRPKGSRPGALVISGLVVGFAGVTILARNDGHGAGPTYGWGVPVLMASSIGWSLGSIFNRNAHRPASPFLAVAMQMMVGGVVLLGVAASAGEFQKFSFVQVTWISWGAWLYLVVAGSIIAYTAYVWLLQASTPARVSTNSYVNPLIAVLLGCTVGHEAFSRDVFMAGALIIAAVVLVLRGGGASRAQPATDADACEEIA